MRAVRTMGVQIPDALPRNTKSPQAFRLGALLLLRRRFIVPLWGAIQIALIAGCASAPPGRIPDCTAMQASAVLPCGRWTGWVKPEKELPFFVTYDVNVNGNSIRIRLNGPRRKTFDFLDVTLVKRDKLTFIWPLERCALTLRDGGTFEGDCALPDGSDRAHMVMIPPGK